MRERSLSWSVLALFLALSCAPEEAAPPKSSTEKPPSEKKLGKARPIPVKERARERAGAKAPAAPKATPPRTAKTPATKAKPSVPQPKPFDGTIGGWTFREKNPMCSFSTEQKVTGKPSIKVVDPTDKDGSAGGSARNQ